MIELPNATRPVPPMPGMARPDPYAPLHDALRDAWGDTLVRLGRTGPDDDAGLQRTLDQVDTLLAMCEARLRIEDTLIHPFIESRAPRDARRIASGSDDPRDPVADLRAAATEVRRAPPARRSALALGLVRRLAPVAADQLRRMHAERAAHQALLWRHFDDAELSALRALVVAVLGASTPAGAARRLPAAPNPLLRSEATGARRRSPSSTIAEERPDGHHPNAGADSRPALPTLTWSPR